MVLWQFHHQQSYPIPEAETILNLLLFLAILVPAPVYVFTYAALPIFELVCGFITDPKAVPVLREPLTLCSGRQCIAWHC